MGLEDFMATTLEENKICRFTWFGNSFDGP